MNYPRRHRDYPDKDCDSLATAHAFLRDTAAETILTKTQSSQHLRFVGTPVSSAASLPPVSSDGTKLGLERSTSKMTSGSVVTWASARGQTPRGGSLSFGARIQGRKRFRYPKRSISCIQPLVHLAVSSGVGGTEESAQFATWK
jgi:hypothetical protein